MKAQIAWSARAGDDFHAALAYLAERSPAGATRLFEAVESQTRRLKRFPKSGRLVPEFPGWQPQLRELIILDYRLVYILDAGGLEVVAFFHGRRLFREDDLADLRAARRAWDSHSGFAEKGVPAKDYFSKRAKRRA